jgi:hypothetical protein
LKQELTKLYISILNSLRFTNPWNFHIYFAKILSFNKFHQPLKFISCTAAELSVDSFLYFFYTWRIIPPLSSFYQSFKFPNSIFPATSHPWSGHYKPRQSWAQCLVIDNSILDNGWIKSRILVLVLKLTVKLFLVPSRAQRMTMSAWHKLVSLAQIFILASNMLHEGNLIYMGTFHIRISYFFRKLYTFMY